MCEDIREHSGGKKGKEKGRIRASRQKQAENASYHRVCLISDIFLFVVCFSFDLTDSQTRDSSHI